MAAGQPVSGRTAKGKEAVTVDETVTLRSGRSPCTENPGRGCGMKQARDAGGGASRREVEKTRGRNVAGDWDFPRNWTPPDNAAKREETPGRTASLRKE
jgi:hypothetical protein